MKALDSLKADINDYNEVLASDKEYLFLKIEELYKNYSKMDLNEICIIIEAMYEEINEIAKETAVLRKMESYYKLFKQEQDNAINDSDFCNWKKETLENDEYLNDDGGVHRMKYKVTCKEDKPFTLGIVKDGEVQKEVKVSEEEFIGIMHEQAEGENK